MSGRGFRSFRYPVNIALAVLVACFLAFQQSELIQFSQRIGGLIMRHVEPCHHEGGWLVPAMTAHEFVHSLVNIWQRLNDGILQDYVGAVWKGVNIAADFG